jgi:hypothetical protein
MQKAFALVALLQLLSAGGEPPAQMSASSTRAAEPTTLLATQPTLQVECCKICRKGKACGNTCIARDKDCHQPPGCACDALQFFTSAPLASR